MSANTETWGGRLPLADPETLSGPQRDLFETITANQVPWADDAGFKATTPDGRLVGPFNAFLLNPEVASKFLAFDAAQAKHSALSERIREVIIIAVGGVWGAEYELYAHAILAAKAGLETDTIEALMSGVVPEALDAAETIAARVAQQISTHHRIDDELYSEAEKAFGARGLFDIAALIGEYHTTCTILNMFAVPAPK